MVLDPTSRPCYVAGPYATPFSTAIDYDNLVLVASGVGITPAMSIVTTHSGASLFLLTARVMFTRSCEDPSRAPLATRAFHCCVYYSPGAHPSGGERRCNLIWVCREAALVEFFLSRGSFDRAGWTLIYYTGAAELVLPRKLPRTVLIIRGRPDLDKVSPLTH
eukprot:898202-Prorocentrum_minimum.AAC.1